MKGYRVDWYKVSTWVTIGILLILFWSGLYYMEWINEFFAFVLVCLAGIFAWESTLLVDEKKQAERKRRGYDD